MSERDHSYRARLVWDGNLGDGTADYETYGRQHRLLFDGKPPIAASADAAFRGDPARLNPEELLIAALASCHMLSYLARFGIDLEALARSRRSFSRPCLDWSERRHHLGGALGAALLDRIFALRCAQRDLDGRPVRFTSSGEQAFRATFAAG